MKIPKTKKIVEFFIGGVVICAMVFAFIISISMMIDAVKHWPESHPEPGSNLSVTPVR